MVWLSDHWPQTNPLTACWAFYHALPLDTSTAGYFVALPVLAWFTGVAIGKTAFSATEKAIGVYQGLLCAVMVGLFGANIFLYAEWGTVLSNRAVDYMRQSPEALTASLSVPTMLAYTALYATLMWGIWILYRRWVGRHLFTKVPARRSLFALPLHLAIVALAIRGGTGVMAINESAVYYSPHLFNNHAATNPFWHLAHSILETHSAKHHYYYMSDVEAKRRVEGLMPPKSAQRSTPLIAQRPNVVFIIMESMTAQVIGALGGEPDICPNWDGLIGQGLLFERCYSSGFRTDQGLVSVLGGYPAQPDQSIVLQSEKAEQLWSVPKVLRQKGYATLFCYGGQLTFANIGVWLRSQEIEHILSQSDFTSAEQTQRWGADDRTMLRRFGDALDALPQPFCATALTLSLHPPFDVPWESKWKHGDDAQQFRHSAAFADAALGEFFQMAARKNWYDNTLFVIVADHGAHLPGRIGNNEPASRHIPLLLVGKPLPSPWHGQRHSNYCNHHDIPATLMGLLGLFDAQTKFPWSRDLLAPVSADKPFAYYTNDNGLGWLDPSGSAFWGFQDAQWHFGTAPLDSIGQRNAQAYLQVFYQDFLNK